MELKLFSKYTLLCETKNYYVYYHSGLLLAAYSNEPTRIIKRKRVVSFFLSFFYLISRLMRTAPRASINIDDDNILFSCNGKIMRYEIKTNELFIEHFFKKGMKNPLAFTRGDGCILYGEYIWNESKGPVSIYLRQNEKWLPIYSFPKNTIQHIHNILFDKDDSAYYIFTGDANSESGIWKANLDFSSVEAIIRGKQIYRSCCGVIMNGQLFYATDTPLEQNYICKVCKNKGIEIISKLPGPVIYGKFINDCFFFSTSVEPDSNLSKWRYRLTGKLGKGVSDRYSHLFCFSKGLELVEICKLKKDHLPMWLFQFGNAFFPYVSSSKIYVVPQSISRMHGKTFVLEERDK